MSQEPMIMQMLSSQMTYMTQRQGVLAQNISNIDTPNYKAKDLKKVDFGNLAEAASGQLAMTTTSPKHLGGSMGGSGGAANFKTMTLRSKTETTPQGNNVVLEDQMAKISDTGAQYQIASTLYKKITGLYRVAIGNHS